MSAEWEFSFLEEGFSAKDIVEQKIKEASVTVNDLQRLELFVWTRSFAQTWC